MNLYQGNLIQCYSYSNLYINFYDFRQCFDKLWLQDCIISLYQLGLCNEMLTLIMITNSISNICVKTPFGQTKCFEKSNIVKQGSVTGSALCSVSIGDFCDNQLNSGMAIGTHTIKSLAYVDDIATINKNIREVRQTHNEVCFFATKKNLPLNEKKCYVLAINCKQNDPIPVLKVNNREVEHKDSVEYLGEVFNSRGDNKDLILSRVRKGTICLTNAIALCCDALMGEYAIKSLLLIYKTVFIPTVLYNSETWCKLSKNEMQQLESLQENI